MARAMFEYTKTVLRKVSFNNELFKKELEKAVNRLLPYEIKELLLWLKEFTINKPELHPCLTVLKIEKRSF
jgi:DNA replication protein DnaD